MKFEPFVTGFSFVEGPRVGEDGTLYFADVMLGGVYRRTVDGSIATVLPDRKWIGGLALNADGGVICSGHGGLWYANPRTGATRPFLTEIDGVPIIAINDIQPDGNGGLYFGTIDGAALAAGRDPAPGALYRLDPGGRVTMLVDAVPMSNGMGLSPDGARLYHSRTFEGLYVYDVAADGGLANATLLAPASDCDGLAVDAEGCVWLAACRHGEVRRFHPDGTLDRIVRLPVAEVLSLCFGGDDLRDFYVATAYPGAIDDVSSGGPRRDAVIYRARSDVPGLPTPLTRF